MSFIGPPPEPPKYEKCPKCRRKGYYAIGHIGIWVSRCKYCKYETFKYRGVKK